MNNLTKVSVSSRRSLKCGDEYLTAEMVVEANVEGMNEVEYDVQVKRMWNYVDTEVDRHLAESVEALTGK